MQIFHSRKYFLCLLLLLCGLLLDSADVDVCTSQTPCKCLLDNGTVIDLSTVGSPDFPRFFEVPFEVPENGTEVDEDGRYTFNPCYSFNYPIEHSVTDPKNHPCKEAAACRKGAGGPSGEPPELHALGLQNTAKFYSNGSSFFIRYTVPDSKRKVEVQLICNESVSYLLTIEKPETENNINVLMKLESKCACPDACKTDVPNQSHGLSTGSILLITFFTILLVYFVFGVLWKFCNGAQGLEMLPNIEFWNEMPKLIVEGLLFTCACFTRKTSYRDI